MRHNKSLIQQSYVYEREKDHLVYVSEIIMKARRQEGQRLFNVQPQIINIIQDRSLVLALLHDGSVMEANVEATFSRGEAL